MIVIMDPSILTSRTLLKTLFVCQISSYVFIWLSPFRDVSHQKLSILIQPPLIFLDMPLALRMSGRRFVDVQAIDESSTFLGLKGQDRRGQMPIGQLGVVVVGIGIVEDLV